MEVYSVQCLHKHEAIKRKTNRERGKVLTKNLGFQLDLRFLSFKSLSKNIYLECLCFMRTQKNELL